MSKQIRNFVFTCNNYHLRDNIWLALHYLPKCYIIIGEEGLDSDTPHLQGYCELSKRISFSVLHKRLLGYCHIEPAVSQTAAIEYCKKEGLYHEDGQPKRIGEKGTVSRGHQESIPSLVKAGWSTRRIVDTFPQYAFRVRGLQQLNAHFGAPKLIKRKVIWIYGSTGVGKSWGAYHALEALVDAEDIYFHRGSLNNLFGYSSHRYIIFDDYRYIPEDFRTLLGLMDIYPMSVNMKGSNAWWMAETIIFTTIKPLRKEIAPGPYDYEDYQQIYRRVNYEMHVVDRDIYKSWLRIVLP